MSGEAAMIPPLMWVGERMTKKQAETMAKPLATFLNLSAMYWVCYFALAFVNFLGYLLGDPRFFFMEIFPIIFLVWVVAFFATLVFSLTEAALVVK